MSSDSSPLFQSLLHHENSNNNKTIYLLYPVDVTPVNRPTSDDKDELMPRKAQLPEGFQPATDESENPENYNTEMNSTAPSFEPKTNEMTTDGMNGDTTPTSTHKTEQQNIPTSASNTTTPPVT